MPTAAHSPKLTRDYENSEDDSETRSLPRSPFPISRGEWTGGSGSNVIFQAAEVPKIYNR